MTRPITRFAVSDIPSGETVVQLEDITVYG